MSVGALLLNTNACIECGVERRFRLRKAVLRCEVCSAPLMERLARVSFDNKTAPPVPDSETPSTVAHAVETLTAGPGSVARFSSEATDEQSRTTADMQTALVLPARRSPRPTDCISDVASDAVDSAVRLAASELPPLLFDSFGERLKERSQS